MNTVPALKADSKDQVLGFTTAWYVLRRTLVTLYSMNFEPPPRLRKNSFAALATTFHCIRKKENPDLWSHDTRDRQAGIALILFMKG